MPLGENSNHFRTTALREIAGWGAHNLTEDAYLGIRIDRRGWEVRMMASVTEEEANSKLGNWLRQRSRWIKGHLQTWLAHTPLLVVRTVSPGWPNTPHPHRYERRQSALRSCRITEMITMRHALVSIGRAHQMIKLPMAPNTELAVSFQ